MRHYILMNINGLFVGTAGVPLSSRKKLSLEGIKRVSELGLDAMELEFVYGVRLNKDLAEKVGEIARSYHVVLTVHAPYYINLLSNNPSVVRSSINRIIESAKIGYYAGAWSIVFHPGFYGSYSSGEAVEKVRKSLKQVVKELVDNGIKIWVRPETMGKVSEMGTIQELVHVVDGIEYASIAIDFAHIYARSLGSINHEEAFSAILDFLETKLGNDFLRNIHIHLSGIIYGSNGERRHVPLLSSSFNWRSVLRVIKEYRVKGVIICESPLLEYDALLIKG
ncbi:MAG: hypothetical protein DRO16_02715, partial [Thermoprotei archaeon]